MNPRHEVWERVLLWFSGCSIAFKTGRSPPQSQKDDASKDDDAEASAEESGDDEGEASEPEPDDKNEGEGEASDREDPDFKPSPSDAKKGGKSIKGVQTPKKSRRKLKLKEGEDVVSDAKSSDTNVGGTLSYVTRPRLPVCLQRSRSPSPASSHVSDDDSESVCSATFSQFSQYTASLNELDNEEASGSADDVGPSYAELLQLIAEHADVKAEPKAVFKSAQFVHLASENYEPPPESLALTTTRSLPEFLLAWWREFANKDMAGSESRALKWGHLFRQRENKPSLRPYIPADDVIITEPLGGSATVLQVAHSTDPPHGCHDDGCESISKVWVAKR